MDVAENVRQGRAKKGRGRAHEGVAEVAVVGAILHFLCEDVAGVAASGDVENLDSTVKDPLPDGVLAKFHVTDPLGGEIPRPVDGGLVIFVDSDRGGGVREGDSSALEVTGEVEEPNSKLGSFVGGPNLGLAGAEGGLILTHPEPGNRPRHAEDDRTAHATELEQRDGGARADGVTELRPQQASL